MLRRDLLQSVLVSAPILATARPALASTSQAYGADTTRAIAQGQDQVEKARIFQLAAFTTRRFAGNPASVMLLDRYADDAVLQGLSAENNHAETAFLVPDGKNFRVRWFTPTVEVPLCGHATLASAAVIMERLEPGCTSVLFHSASGPLVVRRSDDGGYIMDLPVRQLRPATAPSNLAEALGTGYEEVIGDGFNLIARLRDAATVRGLSPDLAAIAAMPFAGLVVTAPGDDGHDCVSRYFAPGKGIPEDPVTGGAHTALTPYWSARLGKREINAYQASSRGGELRCRVVGDRVEIEGACIFYLEGVAQW